MAGDDGLGQADGQFRRPEPLASREVQFAALRVGNLEDFEVWIQLALDGLDDLRGAQRHCCPGVKKTFLRLEGDVDFVSFGADELFRHLRRGRPNAR